MIARINGVWMEIQKQPTPCIEDYCKPIFEGFTAPPEIVINEIITNTDNHFYWLMQHTEVTAFLYKASVWSVQNVVDFLTTF